MPKRKKNPVNTLDKLKRVLSVPKKNKGKLSDRLNTNQNSVQVLRAAWKYINENQGNLRGAFSPAYTPRSAMTALQNLSDTLNQDVEALRSQMAKQRNFANRLVIKDNSGEYAGNGKFYINFVNVGLGDCTLITTPKGKTIMLDCGSDALTDVTSLIPGYDPSVNGTPEEIIGNSVTSKTFLNGASTIDILVLSHPDSDHHNKLEDILGTITGLTVGVVYFGGADAITKYTSSAYIKQIAGTTKADLRKVDLRELAAGDNGNVTVVKQINSTSITATSGKPNLTNNEFIDPATGDMVLYYEDGTSDFRLSVLASNTTGVWVDGKFVKNDSDLKGAKEPKINATAPNKRSLVAMASCFGQNILITGDATVVTERFMVDYFKKQLAKVQTFRIGHHGSSTSSSVFFVNSLTAMNRAVASTSGEYTTVHRLPKQRILALYPPKLPANAGAHDIWAFMKGDPVAQKYFAATTAQLFATGSNDSIQISFKSNK